MYMVIRGGGGGISWNLSSLTVCNSLTSTVTFLILIGYEAPSLTVAMVIVSEWQVVSDDKCPPPPPRLFQGCESICEKKSEIIWKAWKDVLFNALKLWKWGFVKSTKVWNQIKIWTITSLLYFTKMSTVDCEDRLAHTYIHTYTHIHTQTWHYSTGQMLCLYFSLSSVIWHFHLV